MINTIENKTIFNYLKSKKMSHYEYNEKTDSVHFYVNYKIFAILSNSYSIEQLTLRLKPELADNLRKSHKYIIPSFEFMNSYHWSTFFMKAIPNNSLIDLIDLSYELTIIKMTKKQKFKIELEVEYA